MEFGRVPVCLSCLSSLRPLEAADICASCGLPLESPAPHPAAREDQRCGLCRGERAFDIARACGVYEGSLRSLIHLLKYRKMTPLAIPLAERMRGLIGALGPVDVVVPVPLYRSRLWGRGFNQALTLSRLIARPAGLPLSNALCRRKRTRPQAGLSHGARRRNVEGAFAVRDRGAIRGKRVLLVDDVMTTGATATACAKVLKRAGAVSVAVLTAARAKHRITVIDGGAAATGAATAGATGTTSAGASA
jgi:ComF family protein